MLHGTSIIHTSGHPITSISPIINLSPTRSIGASFLRPAFITPFLLLLPPFVTQVLLHSYDRGNLAKAKAEGLNAGTLTAFVERVRPALSDLLAVPSEDAGLYAGVAGGGSGPDTPPEHLPMSELNLGIKTGRLFQGTIRVEKDNSLETYVTVGAGVERSKHERGWATLSLARMHEPRA